MKFTRTLALAAIAAFGLSMTACDEASTAPDAKVEINKTKFTLGTQEQSDLPSLLSIHKNGTIFIKDLDAVPANANNIDLIMYEDFNTTSKKLDVNNAKLWSPDAFASDAVWSTSSLVTKYFTSTTKSTVTKFAKLSITDLDGIDTRGDLDDEINEVKTTDWKSTIDVVTGDVIAINASGTYAIAKVTSATAVDVTGTLSTTDNKAVNMEILVAQKI